MVVSVSKDAKLVSLWRKIFSSRTRVRIGFSLLAIIVVAVFFGAYMKFGRPKKTTQTAPTTTSQSEMTNNTSTQSIQAPVTTDSTTPTPAPTPSSSSSTKTATPQTTTSTSNTSTGSTGTTASGGTTDTTGGGSSTPPTTPLTITGVSVSNRSWPNGGVPYTFHTSASITTSGNSGSVNINYTFYYSNGTTQSGTKTVTANTSLSSTVILDQCVSGTYYAVVTWTGGSKTSNTGNLTWTSGSAGSC